MCVSIYTNKCNMQCLNSGFNKLKMNDLIHVKILIVQKIWKKPLNHSSIMIKPWVVCVLVYYNKCKMQFVNNNFNTLKVNGLTLIIEEMWKKKNLNSFQYKHGFEIVTWILINYGKFVTCNS